MFANLVLSALMVGLTVSIHFGGLLVLIQMLRRHAPEDRDHMGTARQVFAVMAVILGLIGIHSIEVWAYAALYRVLGAIGDLEAALYFSTVTFTTLGYGDVVLDKRWRLISAVEAANGLLLFGWSTAFLVAGLSRVPILSHFDRRK